MKSQESHYHRFLKFYAIALVVFALPLIADYLFIRNVGETMSFDEIVARQQAEHAIYGPAYSGVDFRYRLALIKNRRPDILIVGASRVMEYREEAFRSSFVNAGGAMNHMNEGLLFLKEAFKVHRPKVLIIGLESSWFIDEFAAPTVFDSHAADETSLTRDKLLDPLAQILKRKIRLRDFLKVISGHPVETKVFANTHYGLAAMADVRGSLPDGSALYTSVIGGIETPEAAGLLDIREHIRRGVKRYEWAAHTSRARWKIFEEIVALCKENHVKLVTFLNPYAPSARAAMAAMKPRYDYIDELNAALSARTDFEYYDFRDPKAIGSSECEFLDGHHPGNVACFRILSEIVRRNPSSALASEVREGFLRREIANYAGHALWPGRLLPRFQREADFLGLGCKK
jgi:hypothetical protein